MEAGGQERLDGLNPARIKFLSARYLDEEPAGTESFLAGRRDEPVKPVTGKLRESGDQKVEKVERFFFRRLQDELPEDMGLSQDPLADERGEGFPVREKIRAGEDECLAVGKGGW